MIWKSDLSVLVRFMYVVFVVVFSGMPIVHAASVPVTVEDDLGGVLGFFIDEERATCDPAFWDVLKDRAWQEGQREITQNNNIIARPDSVLQMTCFDSFVNHLTNYSNSHFPGDPQESVGDMGGILGGALGGLSGLFTQLRVIGMDRIAYANGANMNNLPSVLGGPVRPIGTDGFLMYAVLEMLVLDQLVDDAPNDLASDVMRGYDIAERPLLAVCAGADLDMNGNTDGLEYKRYYADDNFSEMFLGGRSGVIATLSGEATNDNYICLRMASIWNESRCYNMLAESNIFGVVPDHDGFYPLVPLDAASTLPNYRDEAVAGRDFRTRETMCAPPPDDNSFVAPSGLNYLCQLASHGLPVAFTTIPTTVSDLLPLLSFFGSIFNINQLPTWDSTSIGANPIAGDPGGVDEYLHFLELRDSTSCSSLDPIKTGYIVLAPNGDRYVDAVCPAPGCFFNPPSTIGGSGSCM